MNVDNYDKQHKRLALKILNKFVIVWKEIALFWLRNQSALSNFFY